MENSLVSVLTNEIYVTNAEFKNCFIKIWANAFTKKRSNMEKCIQDYTHFSKEFNKLDLYGHSMYIYVWKTDIDLRVYRCRVVSTDLLKKTHTIVLIDYGHQMVVPYCSVREVTKDIDTSILNSLSQRPSVCTFFLSEYICKPKPNTNLISTLCNKYYKYRKDFEIGGVTFVTLFDVDNKMIENNLADRVNLSIMFTIANSMFSSIVSNNPNHSLDNIDILNKTMTTHSFLTSQCLDFVTLIDIAVTSVSFNKTSILLTVRIIDNDLEAVNNILNSLDRHNLKLAPVLEVYTPCLVVLSNKLVRAIILEVKIDGLFVALVDYGIRETIPRTAVFEIPPKCNLIEMRSLNVVLDKPEGIIINENMFVQKYFRMLPLKMDLNFGLYKVKLFKKNEDDLIDIFNDISINKNCLKHSQSPELFSITEIQDEIENLENVSFTSIMSSNHPNNNQGEKKKLELMEKENFNIIETESVDQIENQIIINHITPFFYLKRDSLMDSQEIIGLLVYYKSPFNFRIRQYNSDFEPFMNQIKSSLNSRLTLTQNELVKNMHVIYQKNLSDSIYRGQIIDMDPEVEKIKLQLVDEGDVIINEYFGKITLYNFVESDCYLPVQVVLDCALNNMWFPVMNIDTISLLQPHFNKKLLYKVLIIKTDESGVKLVQMIIKDSNIDISDVILKSGIGQRLSAAMKTDECPYEERLLKGQSFLSYIYHYHFKLCIQPEPNIVDELEEEIQEYINKNPNRGSLDTSYFQQRYCLATVNNTQWYRAYIKNINEESVIVNMFDIGLLTDVSFEQIQPITSDLMKKPQLCLCCNLETKDLTFKITEKVLYNVTVKSVDTNGILCITFKEHNAVPLSNPVIRSIEKISFVHVDGDFTYLQRSQDERMAQKLSKTLSELNGKLDGKSIVPRDMAIFENHGKYYRCIVKSINSKMAVVYCIDFGYEKQVEKKKLQLLGHSKIASLPALVTIVKTFLMAFNLSKTKFLANMHVDNDGTLTAVPNKMSSIQIQNELMETLQKGCLVKVSCVYSSDDCWIVPHLYFDRLKFISDTLVKTQSKMIPAVIKIGSLCAAQNTETKKWHRALILDADENTKSVLLIDSGDHLKVLNTTKLSGEMQKIPNCALRCQAVSTVCIKKLLNKDVECKLISHTKPLLEVELFSDVNEITSTQLGKEWKVIVCKFESLSNFYVQKVENVNSSSCVESNGLVTPVTYKLNDLKKQPRIGSIVETLTDKEDGVWYKAEVMTPHDDTNIIVRVLDDGSICKSTKIKDFSENSEILVYHCCLDYSENDKMMNDPNNFKMLSKVMMAHEWIMKTFSDEEPYKVTLMFNGQDCIDILKKLWSTSCDKDIKKSNVSICIDELANKDSLLSENPKNQITKENNIVKDFTIPNVETVTLKDAETHTNVPVYIDEHANKDSLLTEYSKNQKGQENNIAKDFTIPIVETITLKDAETHTNVPVCINELANKDSLLTEYSKNQKGKENNIAKDFTIPIVETITLKDAETHTNVPVCIDEHANKDSLLTEYSKNQKGKENDIAKDFIIPDVETVTITNVETHKCFYAKSESLFKLYMERINTELDMCVVQLPMILDMIGSIVVMNSKHLQCWCRAIVHEISSTGTATCYLLDEGIFDICNEFYKPTDFLNACPPIVRCCSLYTPKLIGKEKEIWFPDIDDMFKDIVFISDVKLDMIIKEDGLFQSPCLVTLILDNTDISEMLVPINVQVTYINSLTDFKIKPISDEQTAVTELLKSNNIVKVSVENPVIGNIYLIEFENKLKRVKFDGLGGVKYVVIDIDDTLDILSVDKLYEVPDSIRDMPPFTMPCSLIFHDDQEMFSIDLFRRLAEEKVVFIMCIITENECSKPNFVKLYHNDIDILNILKLN